jgi:hypothetical protein
MVEAMARIAPPLPSKAMARIAPRLVPQPNGRQQNLTDPQLDSFGVGSRFETARSSSAFNFVLRLFQKHGDRATTTTTALTGSHNITFSVGAISDDPPVAQRLL